MALVSGSSTVESHITNINKLGLGSRVQLGRWVGDVTGPGATTGGERPATHKPGQSAHRASGLLQTYSHRCSRRKDSHPGATGSQ
jgi:hypothetical protein